MFKEPSSNIQNVEIEFSHNHIRISSVTTCVYPKVKILKINMDDDPNYKGVHSTTGSKYSTGENSSGSRTRTYYTYISTMRLSWQRKIILLTDTHTQTHHDRYI